MKKKEYTKYRYKLQIYTTSWYCKSMLGIPQIYTTNGLDTLYQLKS